MTKDKTKAVKNLLTTKAGIVLSALAIGVIALVASPSDGGANIGAGLLVGLITIIALISIFVIDIIISNNSNGINGFKQYKIVPILTAVFVILPIITSLFSFAAITSDLRDESQFNPQIDLSSLDPRDPDYIDKSNTLIEEQLAEYVEQNPDAVDTLETNTQNSEPETPLIVKAQFFISTLSNFVILFLALSAFYYLWKINQSGMEKKIIDKA